MRANTPLNVVLQDNIQLSLVAKGKGGDFMEQKKIILSNGFIVLRQEILQDYAVVLCGDKIEDIVPVKETPYIENVSEHIDCSGLYIIPGLIDIHSDMVETIIVPRKGLVFSNEIALHEADRQLIGHGITTIYHSISIANSTICNRKRTLSVPQMIGIGDAINQYDAQLLIHHRFHARLELNTIEAFESILQRIKDNTIHELSLMNHTPGQGQYASLDAFKVEIRKQYGDIPENQMLSIIKDCQAKPLLTSEQITELLECANLKGIPIAFHDLETNSQLSFMKRHSIRIGEFPLSTSIAATAATDMLFNVVGAPNILRKGSHNKNASATELLKNGWAKIICSDYYSPALLPAIFMLPQISQISLPEAVSFATYYPAQAVHLDHTHGSIAPGKNADIIVVDNRSTVPKVLIAFVDGKKKYQLCYGETINEHR